MQHPIHRVEAFEQTGELVLRVTFADGLVRMIDSRPVLRGELYVALKDSRLFARGRLDQEAGTLVWPNGADFDPAILHDWPERGPELAAIAASWALPARP
jgi:hypothetical protein